MMCNKCYQIIIKYIILLIIPNENKNVQGSWSLFPKHRNTVYDK